VIRTCDIQGIVVILGCFYHRQDQFLSDSLAVRRAAMSTARWIKEQNFKNVVLEIAHEYPNEGYDHDLIKKPEYLAQLIRQLKKNYPDLLVSTSGEGNGKVAVEIAEASDFLLVHFQDIPTKLIGQRVAALRKYGKPIVCNEDPRVGEEGKAALLNALEARCSWGYLNQDYNQDFPFQFYGIKDDTTVYEAIREITH
jgi:hypothetical protein